MAVRIANEVAKQYGCVVAGNLANTWVYDPANPSSRKETRRQFDQQIMYQLPHGVDFFIAETIEYLGEAKIALEAIKATGGCCGTAPHHLRAMAEALGRTVPNSKYSSRLESHTIIGNKHHRRERDERILYEQRYNPAVCDS